MPRVGGKLRYCWALWEECAGVSSGQCARGAPQRKGDEIANSSEGQRWIEKNIEVWALGMMKNMAKMLDAGV